MVSKSDRLLSFGLLDPKYPITVPTRIEKRSLVEESSKIIKLFEQSLADFEKGRFDRFAFLPYTNTFLPKCLSLVGAEETRVRYSSVPTWLCPYACEIVKKGLQFTMMVVGASGTGRTTFVNTLCESEVLAHKISDNPDTAHQEEGIRIKPVNVGMRRSYTCNFKSFTISLRA